MKILFIALLMLTGCASVPTYVSTVESSNVEHKSTLDENKKQLYLQNIKKFHRNKTKKSRPGAMVKLADPMKKYSY